MAYLNKDLKVMINNNPIRVEYEHTYNGANDMTENESYREEDYIEDDGDDDSWEFSDNHQMLSDVIFIK